MQNIMSAPKSEMSAKIPSKLYLNELKQKWQQLQEIPKVFAYRLNVSDSKILPGKHDFYAELNAERTSLRRPPQTIMSLDPPFNEEKFNFKKINPQECIMEIPYEDSSISMIINNSPLTRYHTLIVPDLEKGYAQRITLKALQFCTDLLVALLHENERNFRIGYNSPGALASVNHLHLHLMFIEKDLYIDKAKLQPLSSKTNIYRLEPTMPTEAICFLINPEDTSEIRDSKLKILYEFLQWLCLNNMPHNMFFTPERNETKEKILKIFIYVRQEYCIVKGNIAINTGFCELSGYVPVGEKRIFDELSEDFVIQIINKETGNVFKQIYSYFNGN